MMVNGGLMERYTSELLPKFLFMFMFLVTLSNHSINVCLISINIGSILTFF